jgi:chemotaxis protein CheD
MLPECSPELRAGADENPFRYADSGTPLLFRRAYDLGADKRRLRVYMAGGASVVDDNGLFNIGKRNQTAIRKLLWKAGVLIHGEDVGGAHSRTVRLDPDSGRCVISSPGRPDVELSQASQDWGGTIERRGCNR